MSEQTAVGNRDVRLLAGEVLLWPARILALVVIATCPWYYGSVSWYSQSLYVPVVVAILLLAVVGATLQKIRFDNPLVWSLSALLTLVLLQTVTIPNWLWRTVAAGAAFENETDQIAAQLTAALPESAKLADDGRSTVVLPAAPRTLSLNWVQSRASAATLAAALAWLMASIILFRTAEWEIVLISVLGITGIVMAILGLLQAVAWNNWTLLPMPTNTHFGTFVSRNSGPQFLAVGLGAVLGLLAWWGHSKKDNVDKKYYVRYPAVNTLARLRRRLDDLVVDLDSISIVCIFAATFMFVAVLAAASRGGILACIAAVFVTLGFTLGTKAGLLRSSILIIIVACSTLVLLTTLDLDDRILTRMDSVNQEAYMLDNGRIDVWRMILSEPSYWLPGCGLGNFHSAILTTYGQGPSVWFYHAENIYIELLAEMGLLGLLIGLAGFGWLLSRIRWCVLKGRLSAPSFVAVVFAVTTIGLQSLVDFSLIIPGIFLPFIALVGCFLGRSGEADFGKKKHKTQPRSRMRVKGEETYHRGQAFNYSAVIFSIASVAIVLIAVGIGLGPLRGFAFAEQIASELHQHDTANRSGSAGEAKSAEQLLRSIDPLMVAKYPSHPEVNVQVGRALQSYFEETLFRSSRWPSDLASAQRQALSQPETVAASFRAAVGTRSAQLKKFIEEDPQSIEPLTRSFAHFVAASAVCKMDWRPGWGLLRSDLDTLSSASRTRNYAELSLLTGFNATLPSQIARAALLSGENSTALLLLKRYLTSVSNQTKATVFPLLDLLTPSELQQMLPSSQLLRADVAKDLSQDPSKVQFAEQLLKDIDIQVITSEAERTSNARKSAQTWLAVAWVAENLSDSESQLTALRNAVTAEPMRDDIRAQLAKLLRTKGRRSEALEQAERAYRQSPQNVDYKRLVEELRQE